ncbi:50S ribosomal protein L35 [Candidatus Daviesbacteria bacterium RIFCSPHIGHO2_01_FULL_44_29]|uniref:Large ribosomal subunit protein bL35 n=1 Tax=Candidatus Daviesbacteria bacterium RIFCSPHIGHO2_02_FULL_43_12 TaxID=1797776 RepID=A0A1F5KFM8_9BACT|nr:MAG: 50S ribosomal protein L35 [Candidatus Daviesbacteria bacterium RIFCSPHIGHO2_01_FULL_44_29]OGE38864.1 MAG: 50S ribosomal protein L35 [Candidatus Daviesbacteria bacterium RIFCSPHIGHO2_12_FULL_47_45]OGE39762.1 MAG: 50S ribosomal protein L35 [Candidatus Daviesbacteria bacterium RIFCSPHIGHO2_02_FULL_43_12]OGE69947.1 MAG: 50S ribosomal protein L35 [Candidatus Daviesbacteria bacterium RIFCSPLOWO2_01_FULL_43_15]
MKYKHKTKKSVIKRIKITGTGKIMRSHQLRANHLRRHKSKSALRRHAVPAQVSKGDAKQIKIMLGI